MPILMTLKHPTGVGNTTDQLWLLVDKLVAVVLIAFTAPLMLFVALAIKCESRGPFVVREELTSPEGRRFIAVRFRTTAQDRNPVEPTHLGEFLRWTRLDRLPQISNVLSGDMRCLSLVRDQPFFLD